MASLPYALGMALDIRHSLFQWRVNRGRDSDLYVKNTRAFMTFGG